MKNIAKTACALILALALSVAVACAVGCGEKDANENGGYVLTVTVAEGGTAEGAGEYSPGDGVSLSAHPAEGYTFKGWYEDEKLLSASSGYGFVMPARDMNVTAVFEKEGALDPFVTHERNGVITITDVKDKSRTRLTVPDEVSGIAFGAFSGCTFLEHLTVPFIGGGTDSAPGGSHFGYIFGADGNGNSNGRYVPLSLRSVTVTGKAEITARAFAGCAAIESVEFLSGGDADIGADVFNGCAALKEISLPDGTETVGSRAFYECSELRKITLPPSLTAIGENAFDGCVKLVEIYDLCPVFITPGSANNGGIAANALAVHDSADAESNISVTEDGYAIYADDADGEYYLLGNDDPDIEEAILPDYINGNRYAVWESAFEGRFYLQKVKVGSGAEIGKRAFAQCSTLKTAEIAEGVTTIGEEAFTHGYLLGSVTLPDSLRSVGAGAFSYCSILVSADLPDGITELGDGVFEACFDLTEAHIPTGISALPANTFSACNALEEIVIPINITSIGKNALGAAMNHIPEKIFYEGSEDDWSRVTVESGNDGAADALYFYSKNEPSGSGRYWKYENGVPAVWE